MLHPIPPTYDANSRILILGSFPSVKSREVGYFYGHPQNRFWRVMGALLSGVGAESSVDEKRSFLLANKIALWDVIESCEITGSSDASIKNVVPNDLSRIFEAAAIEKIFTNGKTAEKLYRKYIFPKNGRESICLPSTSPANAAWTFEKLCAAWKAILD